jgi:uncharacterized beta-barrel protein YwiB (DUF1934 family)
MEKINIKTEMINEEKTVFEGKGIKKNNEIIFYDNGIKTKIKLDNILSIKREKDYLLELEFIVGKITHATYTISDINMTFEIFTESLNINKNSIELVYTINNAYDKKLKFIYNVEFSIDRG